jgi:hypothetical protein
MTIHEAVRKIATLPGAEVGHGFKHPDDPDPGYAEYYQTHLQEHPFLKGYPDFLEFLETYSGCVVDQLDTEQVGEFLSATIFGLGPWSMEELAPAVDGQGFYCFSTVETGVRRQGKAAGSEPPDTVASFAFDATGQRPKGVYAQVHRLDETPPPLQVYCPTFSEWLRRFAEAGGRLLPFHEEAESVGKP